MTNTDDRRDDTIQTFHTLVNLSVAEMEAWLDTNESQSVGIKIGTTHEKKTSPAGGESTGHAMGWEIVALLGKPEADLDDDDLARMRKVCGYIKRHTAQRPEKKVLETSRWRYSLMNWGHDPLK